MMLVSFELVSGSTDDSLNLGLIFEFPHSIKESHSN